MTPTLPTLPAPTQRTTYCPTCGSPPPAAFIPEQRPLNGGTLSARQRNAMKPKRRPGLWMLGLLVVGGGGLVLGSQLQADADPPVALATTSTVVDDEALEHSALCGGWSDAAQTLQSVEPDMADPAYIAATETYTATVQRLTDRAFQSGHMRGWQLATFFAAHLEAGASQQQNWDSFVAGEITEAQLYEVAERVKADNVAATEELVARCALWATELEQP